MKRVRDPSAASGRESGLRDRDHGHDRQEHRRRRPRAGSIASRGPPPSGGLPRRMPRRRRRPGLATGLAGFQVGPLVGTGRPEAPLVEDFDQSFFGQAGHEFSLGQSRWNSIRTCAARRRAAIGRSLPASSAPGRCRPSSGLEEAQLRTRRASGSSAPRARLGRFPGSPGRPTGPNGPPRAGAAARPARRRRRSYQPPAQDLVEPRRPDALVRTRPEPRRPTPGSPDQVVRLVGRTRSDGRAGRAGPSRYGSSRLPGPPGLPSHTCSLATPSSRIRTPKALKESRIHSYLGRSC
jgi:hypothetical protein